MPEIGIIDIVESLNHPDVEETAPEYFVVTLDDGSIRQFTALIELEEWLDLREQACREQAGYE